MIKKILLGIVVLILVLGLGLFLWARAVLAGDGARTALAAQLTRTLGHPVTIGGLGVTIFPRIAVNLRDVAIGQPARITAKTLHVGADFRALLSRRIEHADVTLSNARVELPLPSFALSAADQSPQPSAASSRPPVDLVSVDDITLTDVEIVSGGRTLHGDVSLAIEGRSLAIRRVSLRADKTTVTLTGRLTDLAGPSGELALTAGDLSMLELQAFLTDFASGASAPTAAASTRASTAPSGASGMNLTVSIDADRATLGTLALTKLSGRAHVTAEAVTVEPIHFGVFGGNYDGRLTLSLASTPEFRLNASLSGVDMATATAFAGTPGVVTGKLASRVDLAARGTSADDVIRTLRGVARVDVTDGSVKGLGLVRGVVLATSMRQDSRAGISGTSAAEPFSRLGMTLTIANGVATTKDLRFESPDLLLSATGALRLDGSAVDLTGPLQLSPQLSQQAGRDLFRYTQKDGRVTIPAEVLGSAEHLDVRIDVGDMAKRAVTNRALDEAKKALQKKLGLIIK